MKRYPLLIVLLFTVHSLVLCQSSIYLGGGMSFTRISKNQNIVNFLGEMEKKWLFSPNISILVKSSLGNEVAISLGVFYNYPKFETEVLGHSSYNPIVRIEFYRYAIPVRVHWNVFRNMYIVGGIMLNNFYREEYTQLYSDKFTVEKIRPEIALNTGIGAEWRDFLLDLSITRSIFDPDVLGQGQYWILDMNVYYKILSSKEK